MLTYLIRHGESNANAGERTENESKIRLTELGKLQAETTCRTLLNSDITRIVASSYPRAIQTARPLAEKLNIPIEIWPIHEFSYLDPQVANNTTQQERKKLREEFWGKMSVSWRHSAHTESFSEFLQRITWCKEQILATKEITSIFGHGLFYTTMLITLHFPKSTEEEIMQETYRTIYSTASNVRNGQVLKLIHNNGKWVSFPQIPGQQHNKEG